MALGEACYKLLTTSLSKSIMFTTAWISQCLMLFFRLPFKEGSMHSSLFCYFICYTESISSTKEWDFKIVMHLLENENRTYYIMSHSAFRENETFNVVLSKYIRSRHYFLSICSFSQRPSNVWVKHLLISCGKLLFFPRKSKILN